MRIKLGRCADLSRLPHQHYRLNWRQCRLRQHAPVRLHAPRGVFMSSGQGRNWAEDHL